MNGAQLDVMAVSLRQNAFHVIMGIILIMAYVKETLISVPKCPKESA